MTLLAVDSLSKTFGSGTRRGTRSQVEAVVDLTFKVEGGECLTIIGPSGCGKSTLLRLLAGLVQPDSGQIKLQGQPLPNASDRQGRFGYMPQRDTLLPWRTVLDNVILGVELAGGGRGAAREEARQLLPLFGLDGFENNWPSTLSGGMRQRAALLRPFLAGYDILLLDDLPPLTCGRGGLAVDLIRQIEQRHPPRKRVGNHVHRSDPTLHQVLTEEVVEETEHHL